MQLLGSTSYILCITTRQLRIDCSRSCCNMASESPQHKAVQENWNILHSAIVAAEAEKSLLRQFKSVNKPWLAPDLKVNVDGLIQLALTKIKHNVKNYEVFIGMLEDISGLEEPLKSIKGTYIPIATQAHLIKCVPIYLQESVVRILKEVNNE